MTMMMMKKKTMRIKVLLLLLLLTLLLLLFVVVVVVAAAVGVATVPPVPPPVPPSAPPTSDKKNKKPCKRGGRVPLMDDETIKAFALANDILAKRFREECHHNQHVEDFDNHRCALHVEEKKAAAHKLATHMGYVAVRAKLVSQCHELKVAGCNDKQIIRIVPDLIDIVEIITGKKFARPAIDVDESSDNGGRVEANLRARRLPKKRRTRLWNIESVLVVKLETTESKTVNFC